MSHHSHHLESRYSAAALAEVTARSCTALCPGWASFWWHWAGASSSPGCTEKTDGGSEAVGGHLSLSWSGRVKDGAVSLRLSESRPRPCACSRGVAWCRVRRARQTRRTLRGAGSTRHCSAAPSGTRLLCPRCRQPSPGPECHLLDARQTGTF